jgi:hypothetical protein
MDTKTMNLQNISFLLGIFCLFGIPVTVIKSDDIKRIPVPPPIDPKSIPPYVRPLNASPNCTATDFKYGRWIPGVKENCGLAAIYKNDMHRYASDFLPPVEIKPYPFSDWCFIPHNCILDMFNIEGFCRKLRGRSILIAGDSLSHEFYGALFQQLELPPGHFQSQFDPPKLNEESSQICTQYPDFYKNESMNATGHIPRLIYLRNDHIHVKGSLSSWDKRSHSPSTRVMNREWHRLADEFEILILNKGAHYVPPEESMKATQDTATFLHQYLSAKPNRLVIYRTTNQAQPFSSVYSHPNTSEMLTEPFYWTRESIAEHAERIGMLKEAYEVYSTNYHWDMYPIVNNYTVEVLSTMLKDFIPSKQFQVLHAAEMSTLRPDGQRCHLYVDEKTKIEKEECDHLHHYLPSVVDMWIVVLYNLI